MEFQSLAPYSKIQCPDCGWWSPTSEWVIIEDGLMCELCGHHDAVKCPTCKERISIARHEATSFKTRPLC